MIIYKVRERMAICMSTLPKDPMILLSYINTQLRDNYSSLGEMCQILDLDELHIRKTLSDIGFEYVSAKKLVSVRMCRFYLNKAAQVRPVLSLVPPLKGAENR